MGLFDDAFRKVFSDKSIFIELINSFVPDIGLQELKEEDLYLEDVIFKDPYFADREADLLYRINYKGKDIFIYLLIEHQSKVDYLMAFRILGYMVKIWENYIAKYKDISHRKRFRLPPIIPIVFYDGKEEWTATLYFNEKIWDWINFKRFTPAFMYELIDVNNLSTEKVKELKNAVSVLLKLDSAKKEEALKIVEELRYIIENILPDREKNLLKNHINAYLRVFAHKTGIDVEKEGLTEREEVISMFERFERSLKAYIREEKKKAIEEGKLEGRLEGRLEGKLEGRLEGKLEGRLEGKLEGLREGIEFALEMRFSQDEVENIKPYLSSMGISQLNKLKDILKKVDTIEELKEKIKTLQN